MRRPSAAVTDLLSRAVVAMLFTLLVINILGDFLRTGRITGLLLLVGESLVVVLTVIRRRARVVDRSAIAATLTVASVVGPVLIRVVCEVILILFEINDSLSAIRSHNKAQVRLMVLLGAAGGSDAHAAPSLQTPACGPGGCGAP